jgi:hypothetical protein
MYSRGGYYFAVDSLFFSFSYFFVCFQHFVRKRKIQESHFVGDRCPSPGKIEKKSPDSPPLR